MSNEIDDKTRAQVARELAQRAHYPMIRRWLENAADDMDPPRPHIEPG